MQYMGGKGRIARKIIDSIILRDGDSSRYVEPFVGAGWVFCHAALFWQADARGGDAHLDLVLMWQALQDGWIPPDSVSLDEYKYLRDAAPSPLRAFAGYGLSFSGKWFGGYASNARGDDFCGAAKRGLLRKVEMFGNAAIELRDYRDWDVGRGTVIYCDPPYSGTTAYSGSPPFDSADFWRQCTKWCEQGCRVYISEYSCPLDLTPIWTGHSNGSLKKDQNRSQVVENLYFMDSQSASSAQSDGGAAP